MGMFDAFDAPSPAGPDAPTDAPTNYIIIHHVTLGSYRSVRITDKAL